MKTQRHLRALTVGHLSGEKCPQTYMDAAVQLAARQDILLDHIGCALDPTLGAAARACMGRSPRYRWLGGLAFAQTTPVASRQRPLIALRVPNNMKITREPLLACRVGGRQAPQTKPCGPARYDEFSPEGSS